MTGKQTSSIPGVWKPTADEPAKKLANGCEITTLKLSSGSGAAFVSFYDGESASDATPANLKWVLDCSSTDNDAQVFSNPLIFTRGVYAVCEQGVGHNPVVCIARI